MQEEVGGYGQGENREPSARGAPPTEVSQIPVQPLLDPRIPFPVSGLLGMPGGVSAQGWVRVCGEGGGNETERYMCPWL